MTAFATLKQNIMWPWVKRGWNFGTAYN